MGLSIRPVQPGDEVFLYRLMHDTIAEQLYSDLWDEKIREPLLKMQVEAQRSAYASNYPNADDGIIVWDGADIGRMIVYRGHHWHQLVDFTILKQYRGKGIGTWLLRALCAEAELMRKPLRLSVRQTNRAKRLYERMGFREIESTELHCTMERVPGTNSAISLAAP